MGNFTRSILLVTLTILWLAPVRLYAEAHAGIATLLAAGAVGAGKKEEKCIDRIVSAGCYLSNENEKRMRKNIDKCREMKSANGTTTLQVMLLEDSDKMIVVKTDSPDMPPVKRRRDYPCQTIKYTLDSEYINGRLVNHGIKDFKIINNRFWMLGNSGKVFYGLADQQMYELLNSSGKSYAKGSIKALKGSAVNNEDVVLEGPHFPGGELTLTPKDVANRKSRPIKITRTTTQRSLYRDE